MVRFFLIIIRRRRKRRRTTVRQIFNRRMIDADDLFHEQKGNDDSQ